MQYITCRAQKCSEESRQYPFSGRIDTNSLVVQDQYIFLQVQKCVHFIKCVSVCDLDVGDTKSVCVCVCVSSLSDSFYSPPFISVSDV